MEIGEENIFALNGLSPKDIKGPILDILKSYDIHIDPSQYSDPQYEIEYIRSEDIENFDEEKQYVLKMPFFFTKNVNEMTKVVYLQLLDIMENLAIFSSEITFDIDTMVDTMITDHDAIDVGETYITFNRGDIQEGGDKANISYQVNLNIEIIVYNKEKEEDEVEETEEDED